MIWKVVSFIIGSEIILPSPENTLRSLFLLIQEESFSSSVLYTIKRGVIGFFLSAISAIVIGIAAGENRVLFNILKLILNLIQW